MIHNILNLKLALDHLSHFVSFAVSSHDVLNEIWQVCFNVVKTKNDLKFKIYLSFVWICVFFMFHLFNVRDVVAFVHISVHHNKLFSLSKYVKIFKISH